MKMEHILANAVAVIVILVVVGAAVWYIYRSKKKGERCVGCPMAGQCSKACKKGE